MLQRLRLEELAGPLGCTRREAAEMPGDPGALAFLRTKCDEKPVLSRILISGRKLCGVGRGHFDKTSGVEGEAKRLSQIRRNSL